MPVLSALKQGDVGVILEIHLEEMIQEKLKHLDVTPGCRFRVISCFGTIVLRVHTKTLAIGRRYAEHIQVVQLNRK